MFKLRLKVIGLILIKNKLGYILSDVVKSI